MAITFDGVTLDKPRIQREGCMISASEGVLIGGKRDQDSESNYGTEYNFRCVSSTRTNYDLLKAKIGTAGTLLFDSTNMGTYRISALYSVPSADYTTFVEYFVNLRRHTA